MKLVSYEVQTQLGRFERIGALAVIQPRIVFVPGPDVVGFSRI